MYSKSEGPQLTTGPAPLDISAALGRQPSQKPCGGFNSDIQFLSHCWIGKPSSPISRNMIHNHKQADMATNTSVSVYLLDLSYWWANHRTGIFSAKRKILEPLSGCFLGPLKLKLFAAKSLPSGSFCHFALEKHGKSLGPSIASTIFKPATRWHTHAPRYSPGRSEAVLTAIEQLVEKTPVMAVISTINPTVILGK